MQFNELSNGYPRMDFSMTLGVEDIESLGLSKALEDSASKAEFFNALYAAVQNMFESMAKINALGCVDNGTINLVKLTGVVGNAVSNALLFNDIQAVADDTDEVVDEE